MTELKSCPFCGSKAKFIDYDFHVNEDNIYYLYYQLVCSGCGALPRTGGYIAFVRNKNGNIDIRHDGRQASIDAWNRREGNND